MWCALVRPKIASTQFRAIVRRTFYTTTLKLHENPLVCIYSNVLIQTYDPFYDFRGFLALVLNSLPPCRAVVAQSPRNLFLMFARLWQLQAGKVVLAKAP